MAIEVLAFFDTMSNDIQNTLESLYKEEDLIHLYTDFEEDGYYNYNHIFEEIYYILYTSENTLQFITNIPQLYDFTMRFYERGFQKITLYNPPSMPKSYRFDANLQAHFQANIYADKFKKRFINILLSLNGQEYPMIYYFVLTLKKTEQELKQLSEKDYVVFGSICELLIYHEESQNNIHFSLDYKLLLKSISLSYQPSAKKTNSYLEEVLSHKSITADNKYYVWNQFKFMNFRNLCKSDKTTTIHTNRLYKEAYDTYYSTFQSRLSPIPISERNPDTVVVFTIQLLGERHAPTKTTLERCKTLLSMGKKVVLVNTTEQYNNIGEIIDYNTATGSVLTEYYAYNHWTINDIQIPFFQLHEDCTIEDRIDNVLSILHEYKPYYILAIGTGSMLADLMSNVIPCFSMSLVFSTLPHSVNTYKILGRNMTADEKQAYSSNNIIESRFTFELTPQKTHFTRTQFNLPEDAFLITIIGIRLDFEIDEDLLCILNNVCQKGCHIVFAGIFNTYTSKTEDYPDLKKHSTFIGYCEDILALMEICDLYVNPKRLGGGFSVIEAFEKGRPGVYLKTGDVYTSGGPAFSVDTYEDMQNTILKYKNDTVYYHKMSEIAKERAKLMTSPIDAMIDMDRKIIEIVKDRG